MVCVLTLMGVVFVGKSRPRLPVRVHRPLQTANSEPPPDLHLLESLSSQQNASAARVAVRYSAIARMVGLSQLQKRLAQRSAIFLYLFSDDNDQSALQLVGGDRAMFYTGMFFMGIGLLCTALWIPTFLVCTVYGGLYPIIQLCAHLGSGDVLMQSDALLQHTLTIVYLILLAVLLCLTPYVSRFQLFRTDVVDLKRFPPVFYDPCVVREMHRRLNNAIDKKGLERFLDEKFGMDIMRYILEYVDGYDDMYA